MSHKSVFSASWYRVSSLRPRLRSHAQIHRHQYRGQTWYVLQELTKERFFRFTPSVYSVVGAMDGRRTVQDLWEDACSRLGDEAPTQDEMIQLLGQLYQGDVLQCDVSPDAAELLERHQKQSRQEWQSRLFSVFSWRFPILDPERFLRWLLPVVRPFFGWFGALVWLSVVIPGAVLFATHWDDLTQGVLDRVFAADNLLLLWLIFPLIKACHEFGHAFTTRAFGGEVHDMGIMILVLTPVPYVDASSASAFHQKWRRVLVGAAGMLTEVFIAGLALFVWLNAEPGLVRTAAYNTIFIASASTVLFNANPLLRFDGYYILADLLEMPNLRSRATAYMLYLTERYLFGNQDAERERATGSERAWFVSFGVLSTIYRVFIVTAILLYIATRFFTLGVALAIAAGAFWLVTPMVKGVRYLFTSPRIRKVRGRAFLVTATILVVLGVLIALVPVPYRTTAEGVVWIPEESFVRTGAEGFIEEVLVGSGTVVEPGTVLIRLANPELSSQEQILSARVRELEAQYVQYLPSDPVRAETTRDELGQARAELDRVREEISDLAVSSTAGGTFIIPSPEDLPDRFVHKGETLGYVLDVERITVRTVVSQETIDLVRSQTYGIDVRLSEDLDDPVAASLLRFVPGASEQLPSPALGTAGGGRIVTDPTDAQGLRAVEKVFQIDLEIPAVSDLINLGGRGYVRFDHGWAPLAVQWYVSIRQLFLSRFDV